MVVPSAITGKMEGELPSSILDTSLECLLDIQFEVSERKLEIRGQLGIGSWKGRLENH